MNEWQLDIVSSDQSQVILFKSNLLTSWEAACTKFGTEVGLTTIDSICSWLTSFVKFILSWLASITFKFFVELTLPSRDNLPRVLIIFQAAVSCWLQVSSISMPGIKQFQNPSELSILIAVGIYSCKAIKETKQTHA